MVILNHSINIEVSIIARFTYVHATSLFPGHIDPTYIYRANFLCLGNKLLSVKYWAIKNNDTVVANKGCGQTYLDKYTHSFGPIRSLSWTLICITSVGCGGVASGHTNSYKHKQNMRIE